MLEYQLHRQHVRDLTAEMAEVRSAQRERRERRERRAAAGTRTAAPSPTVERPALAVPATDRLRRALRIA
ncbi:hypothetical protein [Streptomyces spiramenti]|uniref:Uncharacterized protein n=1 Tax=Streptomyces spiramenti TaxID=2720606 RepID=A0ABX1AUL6_9ACTN|nr:hypothetical protein [Streptomyces spiramenti]NJP68700.1 hypothetical protein [Streptomyces spiramenti]